MDGSAAKMPEEIVFRPLRSRNLFEETVARLSQAIRLGVVPVGERLPTERELHERLKVSRITIREALRALEEAGFVEIRRGRNGGAYVLEWDAAMGERAERRAKRMSAADLDAAIDYRRAIEAAVAELAAERREEDELVSATEALGVAEGVAPSAFRAADSRFHLALATMAHSPRLAAAAADARLQHGEIVVSLAILTEESMHHSNDQHAAILAAIRDRDPAAARAAAIDHVEATATIVRALYP